MTLVKVPLSLLESLIDSEPCWFDHHGGCQNHLYLSLEPGEICPQQDLKNRVKLATTEPPAFVEFS